MLKTFIFILVFSSCQTENSTTGDVIYGSPTQGTATQPALAIIRTKCINCHTGYHDSWLTYADFAAYKNVGLVVSGDPMASALILKLKNVGGNMPKSAPELSAAEYETLRDWVLDN